jgi:hypothetical protein
MEGILKAQAVWYALNEISEKREAGRKNGDDRDYIIQVQTKTGEALQGTFDFNESKEILRMEFDGSIAYIGYDEIEFIVDP